MDMSKRIYLVRYSDGGEDEIEASSSREAAEIGVGSWIDDAERTTQWIDCYVRAADADDEDDEDPVTVTIDPEEPDCSCGEGHDWCAPYDLLGGLEENPGVVGHGGGVISTEICRHCGVYRISDSWAQRQDTGEQGLESVTYRDADDASLQWVG